MNISLKEVFILCVLALIIAALGTCNFLFRRPDSLPDSVAVTIVVHVAGAVRQPGVYSLNNGARIIDAIDAAGGPLEEANLELLNLAAYIYDGQKIYLPRVATHNEPDSGLININTANQQTLEQLPGIGPAIAQRIISYRESAGGFASIEEITNVNLIGEKTLENIKDLITVD